MYLVVYSGDYKNEYDFYNSTMIPILKKLYNKNTKIYESTKNTLNIIIKSKAITTFKLNSLDLCNRNKTGKIKIPKVIMDSNIELKKNCLSGIIDTDFSLVFRHSKYPKITGGLVFDNKILKNQILEILNEVGLKYNCSSYKTFDSRLKKKWVRGYKIDINGVKNLELWLKEIGFRSSKHLIKLKLWQKYGFCKPFLNYNERKRILMPQ